MALSKQSPAVGRVNVERVEPDLSVRHELKCEKKTFLWTLGNFKTLHASARSKRLADFQFTAGTSFDCPSRWEFILEQNGPEELVLHLQLIGPYAERTGRCAVFLKSSSGEFALTHGSGEQHRIFIAGKPRSAVFGPVSKLQEEGFLAGDDELCLKFEFTLFGSSIRTVMDSEATLPNDQWKSCLQDDLNGDLRKAFETGEDHDVVFKVFGDRKCFTEIKAHRTILSLRSHVFASMFKSGMIEAIGGEVEISDLSSQAMRIIVKFIYLGEVDKGWGSVADELLYGADKYDLKLFRKFLCENIGSILTLKNVLKIREVATLYRFQDVMSTAEKFIADNVKGFLDSHEIIYVDNTTAM